jgi:hypothetical protein
MVYNQNYHNCSIIVQRNNSERSNATSQCIWIQIFLLINVIVLPIFVVPVDLSQQAKSAAADGLTSGLTYSD